MTDILDMHTHTIASGHAYNTIYEMAHGAAQRGVALLGITDHGPSTPGACPKNYFNNFKMLPRQLYGIQVRFGCEVSILDDKGNVDLEPAILRKQDYVVASIHKCCYESGSMAQNTAAYVEVMKNPLIRIIGHPDDEAFPVDYETLTAAAKEYHVLLEVNNNSLNPRCMRKGTRKNYLTMLEYCRKYQVSVIMDSDAHCEIDVGNHRLAMGLLEEIGFPEELVVNRSIEAVSAYLPCLESIASPKSPSICQEVL